MTTTTKNYVSKSMLIVTGMHRSGTSAITRVINLCGATLSKSLLLPVEKDNETGFWECQRIMELHDEILKSVGCTWSSLTTVQPEWFKSKEAIQFKNKLKKLIFEEYGDYDVALIKDPRISKLIPLWEAALADLGVNSHYIICLRNPLEIAQSLKTRNGFQQDYSLSLWFVYLKVLEANTQELDRIFVQYDDLLVDYSSVLRRVNKSFGLSLHHHEVHTENEIKSFLSQSLRHYHYELDDLELIEGVHDVIPYFYHWLVVQSSDSPSTNPKETLRLTNEIKDAADTSFFFYLDNLGKLEKLVDSNFAIINRQTSELDEYSSKHKKNLKEISNSKVLLDILEKEIAEKDSKLKALSMTGESLNNSLMQKQQSIIDLNKNLENKAEEINTEIEEKERISLINFELNSKLQALDNRLSDQIHTSAWKLGVILCDLLRKFRASLLGRGLLLLKAIISFNLKSYLAHRSRMRTVKSSGLFDADYYLYTYPSIKYSIKTPLEHYVGNGEREGRQPNKLFQPYFYLQQITSSENNWKSALVHYIKEGEEKNLDPCPSFSSKAYKQHYSIGEQNVLSHYLKHHENKENTNQHLTQKFSLDNDAPTKLTEESLELFDPLRIEIESLINKTKSETLDEKLSTISFTPPIQPKVSIIVPFYNKINHTLNCLIALQDQTCKDFEVILIDDASYDRNCSKLNTINGLELIRNETNLGYLLSCNKGVRKSKGEFVVQLNNDTLPLNDWLENLLLTFQYYPDAGIVGSMMLDAKGLIQEAGGIVFSDASGYNFGRGQVPNKSRYNYCREVDYCSGASIIIRRELWDKIGGYDTRYTPAYYEDTDLAMQSKALGHSVMYNPFSKVIHHEGVSSGNSVESGVKKFQEINKKKFFKKWKKLLNKKQSKPNSENVNQYIRDEVKCGWILWIDSYTPTPDKDSGSIDTVNFFKQAISDNWGVSFMTWDGGVSHDGKYTRNLQYRGVECINRGSTDPGKCLHSLSDKFDVVVLSRATVAKFAFPIVKQLFPNAKIIFNTVDLHYLRYERESDLLKRFPNFKLTNRSQRIEKQEELRLVQECDLTMVVSSIEKQVLIESLPNANIKVIPLFREVVGCRNSYDERVNIGFIGGYQHPPNVDAVKYFVSKIWPLVRIKLKDCKFVIAGSNLPEEISALASKDIEVRGFIPDLSEFFESVRVMVGPLRYGAGVKGKIVSGLCHGIPQVVTEEAADGMELEHNVNAMITSDPQKFADGIISLYTDKAKWMKMSKNAIKIAENKYSKETVSRKITNLLNDLSEKG